MNKIYKKDQVDKNVNNNGVIENMSNVYFQCKYFIRKHLQANVYQILTDTLEMTEFKNRFTIRMEWPIKNINIPATVGTRFI